VPKVVTMAMVKVKVKVKVEVTGTGMMTGRARDGRRAVALDYEARSDHEGCEALQYRLPKGGVWTVAEMCDWTCEHGPSACVRKARACGGSGAERRGDW
jgi:hypothetical protein